MSIVLFDSGLDGAADKGNATIILNTVDYKQKITSLLEDPSYRRLTRSPTDSTE